MIGKVPLSHTAESYRNFKKNYVLQAANFFSASPFYNIFDSLVSRVFFVSSNVVNSSSQQIWVNASCSK